jgi:glycosyltransferase involved in cell wall biosynthesis
MKLALAHHWLVNMRGGEKVLEQFCALFPEAAIYTLVHNRRRLSATLRGRRIVGSLLQRPRLLRDNYKRLLPFHPAAVARLSVDREADFVLSSDAALVKGLKVPRDVPHVCYCHSPPRYVWEMADTYTQRLSPLKRALFQSVLPRIKRFDYAAAQRTTRFVANSNFVAARIRKYYQRDAAVVHPPVNVDDFDCGRRREDYYLVVSELVPYKRVDLAVEAFTKLGKRLVVIGDGSESKSLRASAGPQVRFLGRQPFDVLRQHYQRCRGFVFPGIEDFGITPLEAQAAGSPVIALGQGGALETVVDGETGLFFREQTVDGLAEAVLQSERQEFCPHRCRDNAERFRPAVFRRRMMTFLRQEFPAYGWDEATGNVEPSDACATP